MQKHILTISYEFEVKPIYSKRIKLQTQISKSLLSKIFFVIKKCSPYQTFNPKITLRKSILAIFWKINNHVFMIFGVFGKQKNW